MHSLKSIDYFNPNMHVYGLWEENGVPKENLYMHREIYKFHIKTQSLNPRSSLKWWLEPLHHFASTQPALIALLLLLLCYLCSTMEINKLQIHIQGLFNLRNKSSIKYLSV